MIAPIKKSLLVVLLFNSLLTNAQRATSSESSAENTFESHNHNVLLAAVEVTDMEEVLDKSGPFTVFAPSDAAFEKFSSSRIKELLNSNNKTELKSLLTNHIVAGHLTASKILRAMCKGNGRASFTTIQGKKLVAHMEGYDIVLTDPSGNTARITVADVRHDNNVIHEIDSVILPSQM